MPDHLDVLVLTRNRPDEARRCVTAVMACTQGPFSITLGFDDDPIGFENFPAYPGVTRALLKPRHYYARGYNVLYGIAKEKAKEQGRILDWFAVLDDDDEVLQPGWDTGTIIYLKDKYPDGMGVADFDGPECCGHFITRAAFVDLCWDGKLNYPGYTQYCVDTEKLSRAKAMDRHIYLCTPDHQPIVWHRKIGGLGHMDTDYWRQHDIRLYNERAQEYGWPKLK